VTPSGSFSDGVPQLCVKLAKSLNCTMLCSGDFKAPRRSSSEAYCGIFHSSCWNMPKYSILPVLDQCMIRCNFVMLSRLFGDVWVCKLFSMASESFQPYISAFTNSFEAALSPWF